MEENFGYGSYPLNACDDVGCKNLRGHSMVQDWTGPDAIFQHVSFQNPITT